MECIVEVTTGHQSPLSAGNGGGGIEWIAPHRTEFINVVAKLEIVCDSVT
jgi:hypothetical protein